MTSPSIAAKDAAEEILGEINLLAEQIGSADGLAALARTAPAPAFERVTDLASLRRFLRDYHSQVLLPLELPAICRAYHHVSRYELRELIELDRRMAGQPLLQCFATASQRVGTTQLKRLRPLRDQRLAQRYLRAVEAGEAHAWHTLVYGLILSLYSLPLRPGLLSYAQQTTRGFIGSVAGRLRLAESGSQQVLDDTCAAFPAAIEQALDSAGGLRWMRMI
jgi:urease accessory protein UreF